jgi:hypothetical protein
MSSTPKKPKPKTTVDNFVDFIGIVVGTVLSSPDHGEYLLVGGGTATARLFFLMNTATFTLTELHAAPFPLTITAGYMVIE